MDKAYDNDGHLIYAKDLNEVSRGLKYKCYNKECHGEFLLKNSGSNSMKSCFYFNKRHSGKDGILLKGHVKDCWCINHTEKYKEYLRKYNLQSFDFADFVKNLSLSSEQVNSANNITTIRQLYYICRGSDPAFRIGNVKIDDIYVYAQTLRKYRNIQENSHDYHLFLLEKIKADSKSHSIRCRCVSQKNFFLQFDVEFLDADDYKKAAKSFFSNKSGAKLNKSKKEFLVLAKPGKCVESQNEDFLIQTLTVENTNFIDVL